MREIELRREIDLACKHCLDSVFNLFKGVLFENETARADSQGMLYVLDRRMHGDEDGLGGHRLLEDFLKGDDAAHAGHANVYENNIGMARKREANEFFAVASGADHVMTRGQEGDKFTQELVVIVSKKNTHRGTEKAGNNLLGALAGRLHPTGEGTACAASLMLAG